ncbi:BnaC01g20760D [Brassica napus]|uniref:BnaC01g20760D protein n=1 Tax=Brassica napus TaxID=3708 RepID=A0A078G1X3_BRANA|nr:BnaC01g20760D [Brassica napus]
MACLMDLVTYHSRRILYEMMPMKLDHGFLVTIQLRIAPSKTRPRIPHEDSIRSTHHLGTLLSEIGKGR